MNLPASLTPKDYKSELKPIWCPGCGDFGVLQAIYRAFAAIGRPPHEIAFISGIGCSSRIPGYTTAYGFNAVHGRALPIAQGLKLARPELLVLADEVTSELDAVNRQRVLDLLRAEARRGAAVVLATHDPEAAAVCDAELHLTDGTAELVRGEA